MALISASAQETLLSKGIDSNSDGSVITITTRGMYWLFNYFHCNRIVGSFLTPKLLADAAMFSTAAECVREFRLKAAPIPTSEDTDAYQLLMFYLDAAPPKLLYTTEYIRGLRSDMKLELSGDLPWKLRETVMFLQLTQEETTTLAKGEPIKISAI